MRKKGNLWIKMCAKCPLCRYTRASKKKGIKYGLFKIVEFFCPFCRMANLKKEK